MKTTMLSLLVSCLLLPQLVAENSVSAPRLTGIINLPQQISVVLEFGSPGGSSRALILAESQREGAIEVVRIKPESRAVELRIGRTNAALTLPPPGDGQPTRTGGGSVALANAGLDPVLDLYASFNHRTLLRSPRLPALSLSLETTITNQADAAQVLQKALAANGISTIPDGEKFLMVVPASETAAVKARSSDIKTSTGNGDRLELMPPGAIYFPNADLHQVAKFYAGLIGRKLDQSHPIPPATLPIEFKNQTPLTKAECVYALDTLFGWQGVKVVPVGNDSIKVVPLSDARQ